MPLYEFRCTHCDAGFEQLTGASAEPPRCPACGAPDTKRTMSRFVAGPARRPGSDFSPVPFDRSGCGCSHHRG